VHTPDLYEGRTFAKLDEGMAYVEGVGFETIVERGRTAAEPLGEGMVYAGVSLGVMPAQMLTQTRPGARGALLLHAAVPLSGFGGAWPDGVPLQIHTMADDPYGDAEVARELEAAVPGAEVFIYPGDQHLFTDRSLPDHDAEAAALVLERVREFLGRAGFG
jgi:dienelactone hydrolase